MRIAADPWRASGRHLPTLRRQAVGDGAADPAGAAGDDSLFHCAVPPPSTGRITPVMKEAASEARKATAAAISDGSAKRPSGTPALVGIGRGDRGIGPGICGQFADDGGQHRGLGGARRDAVDPDAVCRAQSNAAERESWAMAAFDAP